MEINFKKNKGFTLIELLAVIVILAIIALIAVPVVMNIIGKANKAAFKNSAYGILKAGELFYTDQLLEAQGMVKDKTFTFPNDIEGLEIKGSKPTEGYVTVSKNGEVEIAISNGKWCATKSFEEDDVTISDGNCGTTSNENKIGDAVYYNPNEAKLCTEAEWNSNEDKNGKSGCMRWYIYGEEDNKQKLILDHNTTATIEWISYEDYEDNEKCGMGDFWVNTCNDQGPVTLMKQLEEDTANWEIKADIVDAFDLIKIIPYFQELEDINTWQEHWEDYRDLYDIALEEALFNVPRDGYTSGDEYVDAILEHIEKNYSSLMLPRVLYRDVFYENLIINGNPTTRGYWTKTACALDSDCAWRLDTDGSVNYHGVTYDNHGLRPVIVLSK